MSKFRVTFFIAILALLMSAVFSFAQEKTGRIEGVILDETSGEPLPGANVFLEGTALGAATDVNGIYVITGVPAGEYTITVKYIGYEDKSEKIEVKAGKVVKFNATLLPKALEGEEIVVAVQVAGQRRAINEQLSAPTIKNVVAAERIRELPDESAAAALTRLPGVSLMEGDKVAIRGMESKLNMVLVNGVQMPSTDLQDRSTNLGFISANMLDGIEVTKVLTPDMDANAIGGVVNLRLRRAPENLHFDGRFEGNFNTQDRTADNYKVWTSISNRFLNNKLGVFFQFNADRYNGGNDQSYVGYDQNRQNQPYGLEPYILGTVSFEDEINITNNYGGSLILDYDLSKGQILLQNTIAHTTRDNLRNRVEIDMSPSQVTYSPFRDKHIKRLIVSALQTDYDFDFLKVDLSLSHSFTDKTTDLRYGDPGQFFGFKNVNAQGTPLIDENGDPFVVTESNRVYLTVDDIYSKRINPSDYENAIMNGWAVTRDEEFNQHLYTAKLDLSTPLTLGTSITGNIKFGGKWTLSDRVNDITSFFTQAGELDFYEKVRDFFPGKILSPTSPVSFMDLRENNYKRGKYFLGGDYDFQNYVVDKEIMDKFIVLSKKGWRDSLHVLNSLRDDFDGEEQFKAGYLMANLNIGSRMNFIFGGRYEKYDMNFNAYILQVTHSVTGKATYDTTHAKRSDEHFFPNAQLRYRLTDWADVRIAYTKGISRPDYIAMIPVVVYEPGSSGAQTSGNPNLKPTVSTNYDLYVSLYSNEVGLFTLGGFYKKLKDVFYQTTVYYVHRDRYNIYFPSEEELLSIPGLDLSQSQLPREMEKVQSYINNKYPAYIKGMELDWQTNFWYLPRPLNNVVLNVNYTKIWSDMDQLQIELTDSTITGFPPKTIPITNEKKVPGKLVGQPDDVINISLGVDYKGFSGRISMRYQGGYLASLGVRPEEDIYNRSLTRWDFSIRQKLPVEGLTLGIIGINISHSPIKTFRKFRRSLNTPIIENEVNRIYEPRKFGIYLSYSF